MSMDAFHRPRRSALSPTRPGLARVAAAALAFGVFAVPVYAAADPEPAPETTGHEQLTIALEEAWKPRTGDLGAMVERRVIRILTVYSKTFYFVDKGVQRSPSYDAGRLFVEDLNDKLVEANPQMPKHLKVQAVFIPVNRDELLPALAAGRGDIAISGIGVTEGRQKLVDFSDPLISRVSVVVVSAPGSAALASLEDLAGKQVFVRRSSVYYDDLVALNKRFAAENKPAVIIKVVPETLEDEDLIEMVNAGLIPLTVSVDFVANFWKQVFPDITVHDAIILHSGGNLAWAFRKDSPQLKAAINEFVAGHAMSPVGAIGVMQVMPATGEELEVGDITQVEANIHAGIKYLRWMIDRNYGKKPMTNLDKALFAFASYSAGAGRIAGLRKEANRRGLDPNVWFHNVEYVAAKKIGAETVTYVSNIYKYFIAYKLILESRSKKARDVEQLMGLELPVP